MEAVATERLIVRRPGPADLDDLLAFRNHPDLAPGYGGPIGTEAAVLLLEM